MKVLKRILSLLLVCVFVGAALVGCGNKKMTLLRKVSRVKLAFRILIKELTSTVSLPSLLEMNMKDLTSRVSRLLSLLDLVR